MIATELQRQLKNAWLVTRSTVTGEVTLGGRLVTVSYVPAGLARYRFRWKVDGRPVSLSYVQSLENHV